MPSTTPPLWLQRWCRLISNLTEFIWAVGQTVLFYSSTSLRPLLRDLILENFHRPTSATAATMLSTTTASEMLSRGKQAYSSDPATCSHPSGLRSYAGGGHRLKLCDQCSQRWRVQTSPTGNEVLIRAVPKASTSSATPLTAKAKPKAKPKASDGSRSCSRSFRCSSSCLRAYKPLSMNLAHVL